jgi:hypothetical protein
MEAGGFIGIVVETRNDISTQSAIELADSGKDLVGSFHLLSAAFGDLLRMDDLLHLPQGKAGANGQQADHDSESCRQLFGSDPAHESAPESYEWKNSARKTASSAA